MEKETLTITNALSFILTMHPSSNYKKYCIVMTELLIGHKYHWTIIKNFGLGNREEVHQKALIIIFEVSEAHICLVKFEFRNIKNMKQTKG
jgi:hypothetical protein